MMERVYPRRGDVRTVYLNAVVKESLFHEDWRYASVCLV